MRTLVAAMRRCDVWLGFGSIILTGISIGRGTIVVAGSVVTKDTPAYSIAAGTPAKVIGKRFQDVATIVRHEKAIKAGRFALSGSVYDLCTIEPAFGTANT